MRKAGTLENRLLAKVVKSEGCWTWTGAVKDNGYGVLQRGRRGEGLVRAHCASYELFKGPIPDGMDVCHTCDNRLCVKPEHLFIGTRKDNMEDAQRKGRVPRGEGKPKQAKLTTEKVELALSLHANGVRVSQIASSMDVSLSLIYKVLGGDRWKHITQG